MVDWKGCRGLDPSVAAQVTNSMPPYLIANEAKTPFPFSASDKTSMGQYAQGVTAGSDLEATIHAGVTWPLPQEPLQAALSLSGDPAEFFGSTGIFDTPMAETTNEVHNCAAHYDFSRPNLQNQTCWEILTVRLGRFVREQMQAGLYPTDELIQQEARRILYESDDNWNQTAADNPEWLDLFKKAHGLGEVPPNTEEQSYMIEDLGAGLGDLNFDSFFTDNAWDDNNLTKRQLDAN